MTKYQLYNEGFFGTFVTNSDVIWINDVPLAYHLSTEPRAQKAQHDYHMTHQKPSSPTKDVAGG